MAKRFTDTEKWKKAFIKKLAPELKLLWFYILDDCDISGLWQVDLEVASIRIGIPIDINKAISEFDENIIIIDNGEKWFIPSFLEFQYGSQLSKTNNIFRSIEKILNKYDLYQYLNIEITESGTTISSYRNRISQVVRDKVYLQDEFTCQYCSQQKTKNELVVDHFIPLKKGGDNSDENLICACTRCNGHKSDILPDIFLEKDFNFLNPTEKILSLIAAYKTLKAPFKDFKGGKDKDKDKDKDMDKDKDKDKDKELTKEKKPNLEEFLSFCKDDMKKNGMDYNSYEYSLKSKFLSWQENNWKDGNNKPIKSWKSKIRNTIPFLKPINPPAPTNSYQDKVNQAVKAFKPIQQYDNDL